VSKKMGGAEAIVRAPSREHRVESSRCERKSKKYVPVCSAPPTSAPSSLDLSGADTPRGGNRGENRGGSRDERRGERTLGDSVDSTALLSLNRAW
jgi:hypothetical protein